MPSLPTEPLQKLLARPRTLATQYENTTPSPHLQTQKQTCERWYTCKAMSSISIRSRTIMPHDVQAFLRILKSPFTESIMEDE